MILILVPDSSWVTTVEKSTIIETPFVPHHEASFIVVQVLEWPTRATHAKDIVSLSTAFTLGIQQSMEPETSPLRSSSSPSG